jgi:hypothetical protein
MRTAGLTAAAAMIATLLVRLHASVPPPNPLAPGELIAQARTLPAEFAADALIRLSGLPALTAAARRNLLDEAFMLAYATHDASRRSSTGPLQPESRQSAQRFAYDSGLTRLTLQSRAAQLLAFVDGAHARELFESIDLHLAPASCEDPLVPAADEYYSAASLIARTTFAGDRAEAVRFLERHLWRARLPSEMPAVAKAVQRFGPSLDEATYLEGVVRWVLEASARDPRGFSSASLDIVSVIGELQQTDRLRGVPGWYLLDGLRDYLIDRLNGARCADSATEPMLPAVFNGIVGRLGAADDVDRIDERTIRPAKLLPAARFDYYWQTPEPRRLHRDLDALRGDGRAMYPQAVRETKEWRDRADVLLTAIEQWSGRREPAERDYFYQKGALLTGLVDLSPPGSVRTRAVRAFIDFLRHNDTERERRAMWLAMLTRALALARSDPSGEIFNLFEESEQPVLSVYARLERTMRRRASRTLEPQNPRTQNREPRTGNREPGT